MRNNESIGELFNSLTEDQKTAVYALVGQAIEDVKEEQMYKSIMCFAGGMILGGVAGFFAGKNLTEKSANERADKEIKEMSEYYERKREYDVQRKRNDDGSDKNGVHESKETVSDASDQSGVENDNESDRGPEKDRVNYSACYKAGSAKTDLVFEKGCDPTKDDEEPEEDEMESAVEQVLAEDEERRKNANRKPKVISANALDELPPYVTLQLLYYYPETDVMLDEDERLIDEYGYFVGDALEKYGFGDERNTEKVVFVRNYDLDAVYEIQKMPGDDPITAAALEEGNDD